jgi:ribonuclease D
MQDIQKYWRKLSKEEINELPHCQFEGPVHLVRNMGQYRRIFGRLKGETILGFDTESRPAFRKNHSFPPALLQLATKNEVFIFQISQFGLPPSLAALLANPEVMKIGVAVHDDIRELKDIRPFEENAFFDLGKESRNRGIPTNGLRNLAANFLGVRISKSAQRSDWGKENLSDQQIVYAATDAWISREIYLRMRDLGVFEKAPVLTSASQPDKPKEFKRNRRGRRPGNRRKPTPAS